MIAVFADASSIILLEKAGLFDLVLSNYHLMIAPRVLKEITAANTPDADRFSLYVAQKSLHVVAPASLDGIKTFRDRGLEKMDPGERDTICLYLENSRGFLLTDDGQAAKWCFSNDLPFINALLIPKIFWYADLINKDACEKAMAHLCTLGWYSDKIKAFAFDCTRKDLEKFGPG